MHIILAFPSAIGLTYSAIKAPLATQEPIMEQYRFV